MSEQQHFTQIPVSLKGTGEALLIEWRDGVTHSLSWSFLRKRCPCAVCRNDQTVPPEPEALLPVINMEEAQPIKATGMKPIGNYAYGINFSDGHDSGIYALEFLRQLGEETARITGDG
jgi:ATP-binding protein involved in chromosome partitioning